MADIDFDVLPTVGEGKPVINEGFGFINSNFTKAKGALSELTNRALRLEAAAGFPTGAYVPDMGADPHRRVGKVNPAAWSGDTPVASGAGYVTGAGAATVANDLPCFVLNATDTLERVITGTLSATAVSGVTAAANARFQVFDRDIAGAAWTAKANVEFTFGSANYGSALNAGAVTSPTTFLLEGGRFDSIQQIQLTYDEGSNTLAAASSNPGGIALSGSGTGTGAIPAVNKKGRTTPAGLTVIPHPFELTLRQPSLGAPSLTYFDSGLTYPGVNLSGATARMTHEFMATDALLVAAPGRSPRAAANRVALALMGQDAEGNFGVESRLPLPDGVSDVTQVWALTASAAFVQVFSASARTTYLVGIETDATTGKRRLVNRLGAITAGAAAAAWPFAVRAREGDRNALLVFQPGTFASGSLPVTVTPLILNADGSVTTGTARTFQAFQGAGLANVTLLDVTALPSGRVVLKGWSTNGQIYLQSFAPN